MPSDDAVPGYFSVDPSSLAPGLAVPFAVYAWDAARNRALPLLAKGASWTEQLGEGLESVLLQNDDLEAYRAYLKALASPTPVPPGARPQLSAPREILRALFGQGHSADEAVLWEPASQWLHATLALTPDGNQALAAVRTLPELLVRHSVRVAALAAMFCHELKPGDTSLVQDMASAGLCHDLGLQGLAREQYPDHVNLGLRRIAELRLPLSARALTWIEQHHEKFDGTGYPRQVRSFRFDELSQLLALANLLENLVNGRFDGKTRTPAEALAALTELEHQRSFPQFFNPEIFRAARELLV